MKLVCLFLFLISLPMLVSSSVWNLDFDSHLLHFFFTRTRISRYDHWISSQVSLWFKHGKALFILMMSLFWAFFHKTSTFSSSLLINHRGLRSKRIKRIEHNLAINLKETHRRIWNGVTKDVGYIRKVLNEVYFMKFKVSFGTTGKGNTQ